MRNFRRRRPSKRFGVSAESYTSDSIRYHTVTSSGEPALKVFANTAKTYGVPWTLTFSHEILETLVDPSASACVFLQDSSDSSAGVIVAFEVCDPCQDEIHGYKIDDVVVSDFVFPSWFEIHPSNGPFDFTDNLKSSLSLLPGGYVLLYRVYRF